MRFHLCLSLFSLLSSRPTTPSHHHIQVVRSLKDAGVEVHNVFAGGSHSLFLTKGGDIYAAGRLSLGRLGLPAGATAPSGRPVDDNKGLGIATLVLATGGSGGSKNKEEANGKKKGTSGTGGSGGVQTAGRVSAISAGGQHSCVVVV
jgi:hypothetical protein